MSGYLTKVIAIFVIAAIGAGIHLAASWPVQLKAEPDQPPPLTINIPGQDGEDGEERTDTSENDGADAQSEPEGDSASASGDEPGGSEGAPPEEPTGSEDPADEAPAGSVSITLDTLEIDLATSRALHENGLATFVDARPQDRYEAGHIADAMHITPGMLEADSSLFVLDVIDPTKPIVIYCDGGDCDDSHRVAEMLQDLRGLEQTHVFADGYPAWERAGLPTATGPDPWAE